MFTERTLPKLPVQIILLAALALGMFAGPATAAPRFEDGFPEEPDPFVGDWKGRWSADEDVDPDIGAKVIALGRDEYRIRLVSKLFMRCRPWAEIEVKRKGDTLSFNDQGYKGEIKDGTFTGGRRVGKATFEMKKYVHESPTLGAKPPEGAIVLFDGTGFDQWTGTKGWRLLDGVMMVTPDGSYLETKQHFKDVELHVEFRLSHMPGARGQARANSGVFCQGVYEVQILDSFGLEGYYNECGALYKVSAPKVNACAPPLQWQTFDITYRAPRYDESGKLVENPRMNVHHNGMLIQKDQEMPWITAWKEVERFAPPPTEPGPIKLQGHGNFIQFRNIWVVDLAGKE